MCVCVCVYVCVCLCVCVCVGVGVGVGVWVWAAGGGGGAQENFRPAIFPLSIPPSLYLMTHEVKSIHSVTSSVSLLALITNAIHRLGHFPGILSLFPAKHIHV